MRATEQQYRTTVLELIETRLGTLAQEEDATKEIIHYHRGLIFGLMAALAGLHLISEEEKTDIIERTDNISKLKYQEILANEARVRRN